jgi:hypothetical protein
VGTQCLAGRNAGCHIEIALQIEAAGEDNVAEFGDDVGPWFESTISSIKTYILRQRRGWQRLHAKQSERPLCTRTNRPVSSH